MVVTGHLSLAPWKLVVNGDGRTSPVTTDQKFPVFQFGTIGMGSLPAGREDYNLDGVVDGADLNLVLSSYDAGGAGGGPPYNSGDLEALLAAFGNGGAGVPTDPWNASIQLGTGTSGWSTTGWDLVVEGNQLMLTGIASTGGAAAVPEPGTLVLLVLGLLAIVPIARRRK